MGEDYSFDATRCGQIGFGWHPRRGGRSRRTESAHDGANRSRHKSVQYQWRAIRFAAFLLSRSRHDAGQPPDF